MAIRIEHEAAFRSYQRRIERLPALDRDAELELARRYQAGDQAAGDSLALAHLRAVVMLAKKFSGYGIPVSELVAEGNIGLLEAVRRFEPERGLRFLTYARYWVRAFILAYVLKHWSIVDMGSTSLQSKLFFRLQAEHAKLEGELGDDGTIERRLAAKFGTSEDHVRSSLERLRGRDASLDAPLAADVGTTFLDMLRDDAESQESRIASAEMTTYVRQTIAILWPALEPRERRIVCARLLGDDDGASLAELGREMGVTRERVRQLEVALKAKLKAKLTAILAGEPQGVAGAMPCPCAA